MNVLYRHLEVRWATRATAGVAARG